MVCLPVAGTGRVADDGAVGDGGVAFVDDERDVEGGLEGGLVEGGEGAARIGGFELRDGVVAPGGLGEIEAAEFAVEDAGVFDCQSGFTGGELIWATVKVACCFSLSRETAAVCFFARCRDLYGLEGRGRGRSG